MTTFSHQDTHGDAYLARLAKETQSANLKSAVKRFKAAHDTLKAASDVADTAHRRRNAALTAVGTADEALDASVLKLADALVTAKLGVRRNPFAGFSKYAPAKLVGLAYADQLVATRALVTALKDERDAPTAAITLVSKRGDAVEAALKAYEAPQTAWHKAIAQRDALLPAWQKALTVLRAAVTQEWPDDSAIYDVIFAPPASLLEPAKPTPKTKAKRKAALAAKKKGTGEPDPTKK